MFLTLNITQAVTKNKSINLIKYRTSSVYKKILFMIKSFDPKTKNHQNQGEDLQNYLFLPWGEAREKLGANLVHPNFANVTHTSQT